MFVIIIIQPTLDRITPSVLWNTQTPWHSPFLLNLFKLDSSYCDKAHKKQKPQSLTSWNWASLNRRVHRGHKERWRRGKWQLDSKFMRKEWRGEESCWGKPWVLASAYKVFAKGSRGSQANIMLAVLAQRRRHRIQNLWAIANIKMKYLPWHKRQNITS